MEADRRGCEGGDLAVAAARPENTAAGQKLLREKMTAKAAALVPLLRAKAAEIERQGRIPDEVLAAIDSAQLFRLRTPKRFGGFEADIRTYMDVVAELGRGCGSTSWIGFISIATVWIAALFPDEAQREVFAGNPDVRFMGALGMTARGRTADGGYRLDGKWAYASNCLHAHWAVLSAPLPQGDTVVPSILLAPMRELAIEESWHVVGMRGTGSHTVIAKDIFVPAHRALPTEILAQGRSPRTNRDESVYRESFMPTAIIAVAAPVLGLAQAALELTFERINKSPKAIAYSFYDDLRRAPSMQRELAEAATLIETAVLHVRRWCDDIAEAARAGASPSARRCAWISAMPWRAAAKRSGCCSTFRVLPLSPSPTRCSGYGAIWKWRVATGSWPAKFRRKSMDARWSAISSRCRRWFDAILDKSVPNIIWVFVRSPNRNNHSGLGLLCKAPLTGGCRQLAIRSASMKKLCLAGAAAVLLIGTTALGFAQSGNSSQKMSPGHEMQKRGNALSSPGHHDTDDRGTLRDRDDRMMNHDRD